MIRDICALEWNDPHTEKFGRKGQEQMGVDVYGRPIDLDGIYRAAQCKLRTKKEQLTEREIEAEVSDARRALKNPTLGEILHLDNRMSDRRSGEQVAKRCNLAGLT
jgi:hypothetical protein